MSGQPIDFAERRYRALIGKRIVHTTSNGKTLTGTVLPGLFRWRDAPPDAPRWFRVRSREIWYARIDAALTMRLPPLKKDPARFAK